MAIPNDYNNLSSSHVGLVPLEQNADIPQEEDQVAAQDQPGIFSYISSAASAIAQSAVTAAAYFALPFPGLYKREIGDLQDALFQKTNSHIAAETAKTLSKYQVNKFLHQLGSFDTLGIEDANSSALKKFLNVTDGVITITSTGQAFLNVLENHTDLVVETFELNILRAMSNGITFIQNLESENPYFLVKLIQDVMQEVVLDVKNFGSNPHAAYVIQNDYNIFLQKMQQVILKAIFPNNENDIEIPISLQGWINSSVFMKIQEEALPKHLPKLYEKATSELTKYKILAKGVQALKKTLSRVPERENQLQQAALPQAQAYPQQQQFNTQLLEVVMMFLDQLNVKFLGALRPILKKITHSKGAKLVAKIRKIQSSTLINSGLKQLCQKINLQGSWQTFEGKDIFIYVPVAPKTIAQKEVQRAQNLINTKQVITQTVESIAHDLSGIKERLSKVTLHEPIQNQPETSFQERLRKIVNSVRAFFSYVKKACISIIFAVCGIDKQIAKLSKKVISLAQKVDLKQAVQPIIRTIIKTPI